MRVDEEVGAVVALLKIGRKRPLLRPALLLKPRMRGDYRYRGEWRRGLVYVRGRVRAYEGVRLGVVVDAQYWYEGDKDPGGRVVKAHQCQVVDHPIRQSQSQYSPSNHVTPVLD